MAKNLIFLLGLVAWLSSCDQDDAASGDQLRVLATDTTFLEGNRPNFKQVRVTLSAPSTETIVVDYETANGTAVAGIDYTQLQNRRLTFDPSEVEKFIEIEILGNERVESDKFFYLDFPFATNASVAQERIRITIENDDFDNSQAGKLVIPTEGYMSPESYEGMTLVWRDEFDGPELNMDDWAHDIGDGCPSLCGWGNAELQYYQPDNTSFVDGNLVIEAKRQNVGGSQFTSSKIVTKGKQEFTFGRIDIRAALPYGQGIWPALWMLGANIDEVSWPRCGEIDIMELVGGGEGRDDTVHGTMHWSNNGHTYLGDSYTLEEGIFADKFHVFSIIWDESSIRWFVNDIEYHSMNLTPAVFDAFRKDFYFIFNIAVGGTWPGNPVISTVFPQYMVVDYVRVFQEQ